MNSLIFFFSALGVFNGILLSLYFFFFAKEKSLSKYLLGALILALSIRIGKSILLFFNPNLPKVYLQLGLSACLFIGPLLFFYLKTVTNRTKRLPRSWKWCLITLLASIAVFGIIRPYQSFPTIWNTYVVQSIYFVWFIGISASGWLIIPRLYKSLKTNDGLSSLDNWLAAIYFGNTIIAFAFFLALFGNSMAYYITGPLVFTFFLYLIVFGYFNNQWFDLNDRPIISKYQNKKIESSEATLLKDKLAYLIEKERIFINPTLKLGEVAAKLNISTHQLSQFLNDNLGMGFKPFINQHRINAACDLIGTNHDLSLEGIGYEVGFRSKSTFFTTFKKLKKVTPAQYQQEIAQKPE